MYLLRSTDDSIERLKQFSILGQKQLPKQKQAKSFISRRVSL